MIEPFSREDFSDFRTWLNLDLESLTWEGKFKDEFEEFWEVFFMENISLKELRTRFNFALNFIQTGTLNSWIEWLNQKFSCYLFIKKNISLYDLALSLDIPISSVAVLLRDFFLTKYPQHEKYFNEVFQVSDLTSPYLYLTFNKIQEDLQLGFYRGQYKVTEIGCVSDDFMTSTEVTLYPEWKTFQSALRREALVKEINYDKIQERLNFRRVLKFVQEVFILCSVTLLIVYGLKIANRYYENYLSEKISIYEPEFLWLDKSLTYKQESNDKEKIELDLKALEELTKATQSVQQEFKPEERFDTESEVTLTSVDKIPKDSDIKPSEPTVYEENAEGYRDVAQGERKVYRLLMKSVSPLETRDKLNKLLITYSVTQVDKVKPGTQIPGGIYYNLHVPKTQLTEFLKEASDLTEITLFESRTKTPSPAGKTKVFIWIKGI